MGRTWVFFFGLFVCCCFFNVQFWSLPTPEYESLRPGVGLGADPTPHTFPCALNGHDHKSLRGVVWREHRCTTSDQLGVWTNIVVPKHQIELLQGHSVPSSQTTRTLVSSKSQPTAHIPILAPGHIVKMEEGRTANSVLVSSTPPLDDFGEQPKDRYLWGTIQGLGGRRPPLPDMKLTLEHFIMSGKEKLVFTVFSPQLFNLKTFKPTEKLQ